MHVVSASLIHPHNSMTATSMFMTGHVTVTHKLVSNSMDKVSITELGPKVSANTHLTWLVLLSRNVMYSTNPHVVIL